MKKTVFISSTFEDLKEHRKKLWDILTKYEVNIRGMERFGARKEAPLQTCLAEVAQSDIFIGVISYRLGTIDPKSSKSFVQLEYEKALELNREVFIYLIDDKNGRVTPAFVDFGENHEKLESFKSILKERHTIDTFTDEADLGDKLDRKFDELLSKKTKEPANTEDEYKRSHDILEKFLLLPKEYSSKEVKLKIKFEGDPFPASKAICKSFYLSYGLTLGIKIKIILPNIKDAVFNYLFIESKQADQFFRLDRTREIDVFASLIFTEDTIDSVKAHFVSKESDYMSMPVLAPLASRNQMEGEIILLLKEFVSYNEKNTESNSGLPKSRVGFGEVRAINK